MGRPFQPTQSLPVLGFGNQAFMTERDTYRQAQGIINKELSRAHEIQPYASTVEALDLAPSTRAELDRRLRFGPDGEVKVERVRGTKRSGNEDDEDEEVSGEEEMDAEAQVESALPSTPLPNVSNDFPEVFKSPNMTQPELFADPASLMPPPPVPSRAMRGLPQRGLSKTVSAPVGRLGTWSGMDIDPSTGFAGFTNWGPGSGASGSSAVPPTQEEDGFDVSEWASSDKF